MNDLITKEVRKVTDGGLMERRSRWQEFRQLLYEQPKYTHYDYPFKSAKARNNAAKIAYAVANKWGFSVNVTRIGQTICRIYKFDK